MRWLQIMRRSLRSSIFSWRSEPHHQLNTTKGKTYTGSYADLMKKPAGPDPQLQDPSTGLINWMMDYDPLP